MKTPLSGARIVVLALTLLCGGLTAPREAQAGGAGSLATNFVGRFYFNPNTLQGFVAGYLPDIAGITGPLFDGSPGEGTAYFTFRSNVFQFTQLPTNGDLQLFLLSAGTYAIYFNAQTIGDWSNPIPFRAVSRSRSSKDRRAWFWNLPISASMSSAKTWSRHNRSSSTDTTTISVASRRAA